MRRGKKVLKEIIFSVGLKKMSEWERYEEQDAVMRSQYYDPIERFPERIDRLLEILDRVRSVFFIL